MSASRTVAVVGVGSVGGYFAAQAQLAGHSVVLCARTAFDRLVVETGGDEIAVDGPVYTDPAEVGPSDWVLLAVKAHQTAAAAPWLEALCGPDTVVVVLQNGVEQEEMVSPLAPQATVVPTVVRYGGEATAPGRVKHYTYGYVYVPESEGGHRLAKLFEGSDTKVTPTPDFYVEAWSKLVTNVAANAIPAVTEQRFPVFRRPDVARLAEGLMRECIEVAAAVGIPIDPGLAESEVKRLAGLPDNVGSSMLYDRLSGRALEYDALNGAVARIGDRHGVATPLNQAMIALLAAISDRSQQ